MQPPGHPNRALCWALHLLSVSVLALAAAHWARPGPAEAQGPNPAAGRPALFALESGFNRGSTTSGAVYLY